MAFKITWEKVLKTNQYFNRYNPVISKVPKNSELYGGILYAYITETSYKVECQKSGQYGHLYPKILIEEGSSLNLNDSKVKVRKIFQSLCSEYDT